MKKRVIHHWAMLSTTILLIGLAGAIQPADDEHAPPAKADDESKAPVVDAETDAVIRGALRYLKGAQYSNGAWAAHNHLAAMNGYVLMTFMGCGELPGEGEFGPT